MLGGLDWPSRSPEPSVSRTEFRRSTWDLCSTSSGRGTRAIIAVLDLASPLPKDSSKRTAGKFGWRADSAQGVHSSSLFRPRPRENQYRLSPHSRSGRGSRCMAGLELVLLLLAVSAGLRLIAERLRIPYAAI